MDLWKELGFEVICFSNHDLPETFFYNKSGTYYFACRIKNCVFGDKHRAVTIVANPSDKFPIIYVKFYLNEVDALDEIESLIDLGDIFQNDSFLNDFEKDRLKIYDFLYFSCLEDLFDLIRTGRIE